MDAILTDPHLKDTMIDNFLICIQLNVVVPKL